MKYLKGYKSYNEGIKSSIATAGIVGSLLATPVNSQPVNGILTTQTQPMDGMIVAKNNFDTISKFRKESDNRDEQLSNILNEIESHLNSKDSAKYIELFTKLSGHLQKNYGYKIQATKVEQTISTNGVSDFAKNLSLFEIMGWLGSICLAICGIPQAFQSYKDKHSEGISWAFLLLWAFGELFALIYVYDKLDMPLLMNYATNIFILGVILYYKAFPKNSTEIN